MHVLCVTIRFVQRWLVRSARRGGNISVRPIFHRFSKTGRWVIFLGVEGWLPVIYATTHPTIIELAAHIFLHMHNG